MVDPAFVIRYETYNFLRSSFGCDNVKVALSDNGKHCNFAFEVYIFSDSPMRRGCDASPDADDDDARICYTFGVIAQVHPRVVADTQTADEIFSARFMNNALFIIRVFDDDVVRRCDFDHLGRSTWTYARCDRADYDIQGMMLSPRRDIPRPGLRAISCGVSDLNTIIMREIRAISSLYDDCSPLPRSASSQYDARQCDESDSSMYTARERRELREMHEMRMQMLSPPGPIPESPSIRVARTPSYLPCITPLSPTNVAQIFARDQRSKRGRGQKKEDGVDAYGGDRVEHVIHIHDHPRDVAQ